MKINRLLILFRTVIHIFKSFFQKIGYMVSGRITDPGFDFEYQKSKAHLDEFIIQNKMLTPLDKSEIYIEWVSKTKCTQCSTSWIRTVS